MSDGPESAGLAALHATVRDFPVESFTDARTRVSGMLAAALADGTETIPALALAEPWTRLRAVRDVYDATVAELGQIRRIEDALAALKAALVDRLATAACAEAGAEHLDAWQASVAATGARGELGAVFDLPAGTAGALTGHCTTLVRDHPAVYRALREGRIDWAHTLRLLDEVDSAGTPGTNPDTVAGFEAFLLGLAEAGVTIAKFARVAKKERARRFPDSIQAAATAAREDRRMSLHTADDGMSILRMYLPTEAAEAIFNRHTAIARALAHPDEIRTLTQRRLDSAVQALFGQGVPRRLNAGDGTLGPSVVVTDDGTVIDPHLGPLPAAEILVTVPFLSLLGVTNEPGQVAGGGPVPASIARALAGNAPSFLRVLTDPVTGIALDLHPDRYRVSAVMRARLRTRDGTCTFKGCSAAATVTEIDHILAWEDGGPTVIENLHSLCKAHHLLKHLADRKDKHGNRPPPGADLPAIRAWRPIPSRDGHGKPGWQAPSGRYYPPDPPETTPPLIPEWIFDALNQHDDRNPPGPHGHDNGQ
ncbi:HNH endonuclease signature motif containing protein [Specibacter cremeus]|uniref:HNH endonuclease signature motif containing protein n=1 Tax=Specibacter cremeus TaxID=1629051 RepID=UPI000F76958A|nr:HNH endonuclease signature motif containing protein [Specibacter cremeus]